METETVVRTVVESPFHMAYGEVRPELNPRKRRKVAFKSYGDTEELLRHLRPNIAQRVLRSRSVRQRSAAKS